MKFSIKSINYNFDDFVIVYFTGVEHKIILLNDIINNTVMYDIFYKDNEPFDISITYCKYNKLIIIYKNKLNYEYENNQLYLIDNNKKFKQIDNNHIKFDCSIMYFKTALKTYIDPLYLITENKYKKNNYKISYLIEYLTTQTKNINDKKYILIKSDNFNKFDNYLKKNEDKIKEKNGSIIFFIDNDNITKNINIFSTITL